MERKIIREIENESPDTHWGFLPVENKVVLDLGCGLNSEFMPTPYFFIQERGAAKVIGVDPNQQSYEWYKQNYNVHNFICHMDYVDRIEKLEWYLANSGAIVAKIDIEGSEIHMMGVKPEIAANFSDIAVEFHSYVALLSVENFLKENGFEMDYYKFPHLPIDHQGVIHGYKRTGQVTKIRPTAEQFHAEEMNKWNGGQ